MGAMAVLWSFLGVLKHLLPMFITIKKIIIVHLFLGVPAATVGGTGTPWHTRGYAPGLRCSDNYLDGLIKNANSLSASRRRLKAGEITITPGHAALSDI